MKLTCHATDRRHLRAPREDQGVLVDPPLHLAGDLIEQNAAAAAAWDYDLSGRGLAELAAHARRELVQQAREYTSLYRELPPAPDPGTRIVLAGHQPQLFHPGVWFKNFALSALAGRHAAVAVNLAIDSDTIKTASLRVPGGTASQPLLETVPFDRPTDEIPYEERSIVDRACLAGFGAKAQRVIQGFVPQPLLEEFWPRVVARSRETDKLGECLAQARHEQEGQWGAVTLELPQSRICGLAAFHWFTCHLLARLPRLWEEYNRSVAEYRRANHLRSVSHPVPDLATDQQWLEAPFWIWQTDNPRRRRLFARASGEELLLTDRKGLELRLPLTAEGDAARAVEQFAALADRGIKIRTRALVTTMFARLFLGDLFLHGIGGAKYDQVTDSIIAGFFGIEPPCYMTVTATLRLPIPGQAASGSDSRETARGISQRLRDLDFHPERFLDGAQVADAQAQSGIQQLVDEKQRWIATPPTRENAKARCQEIRRVNQSLQPWLEAERRQLLAEREATSRATRADAILSSRDFAFCLYPEEKLRALLEKPGLELGV
jgi:hypothetical protein